MKKSYFEPKIEVEAISSVDIIALSPTGNDVEIDGGTLYGNS